MIAALIPFITGALGTVIDRVIPDTAARDAAKLDLEGELLKLAGESNLAQIELNAAEASGYRLDMRAGADLPVCRGAHCRLGRCGVWSSHPRASDPGRYALGAVVRDDGHGRTPHF